MKVLIKQTLLALLIVSIPGSVFGNPNAMPETMIEAGWNHLAEGIQAVANKLWKNAHQHNLNCGQTRENADTVHSQLYRYDNKDILKTYPNIKIELLEHTNGKRIGHCHDYTVKKLMNIDLEDLVNRNPIGEKIVNNFEISPKPQPGYLCVYGKADLVNGKVQLSDIIHTGIVCDDGKTIESRYGEALFKQHVSHVPKIYGNHVVYFKPPSPEQLRLGFGVSGWEGIAQVASLKQQTIDLAKSNPNLVLHANANPHDRKWILAAGIDLEALSIDTGLKGLSEMADVQFSNGIDAGLKGISHIADLKQDIINMAKLHPNDLLQIANDPHHRKLILTAGIDLTSLDAQINNGISAGLKGISKVAESQCNTSIDAGLKGISKVATDKLIAGTIVLAAGAYGLYNWYNKRQKTKKD